MILDTPDDTLLTISGTGGKMLVKIAPDGSIEYGEHYSPDEAAKIFWDAIAKHKADMEADLRKQEELLADADCAYYFDSEGNRGTRDGVTT